MAGVGQRFPQFALSGVVSSDPQKAFRPTDLNVGRNPEEVLRVLDALQTDELCPCNWQTGDETLKAA
ncbi:MAG TPA: hypothetical protein VK650_04730 [Steroidobacteraceae bacterium]|nr:hypothetical protein [Steroidobacteraceae bacterium]